MKTFIALSVLILMGVSVQVKAAALETLSCRQLQKARVVSKTNFNNLYCIGKTENDSEKLHDINTRMEFEGRRIQAILDVMDQNNCKIIPSENQKCAQDEIKEQNCKRAVSNNDYDAYSKYCL